MWDNVTLDDGQTLLELQILLEAADADAVM